MKLRTHPFIFIIESDRNYRNTLEKHLLSGNYWYFKSFNSTAECMYKLSQKPDVIIAGYPLPEKNDKEVFKKVRESNPEIQLILLTENEDSATVLDLMEYRPFDFLKKNDKALQILNMLLNNITIINRLKRLRKREIGLAELQCA
ncbi:MAG: response regulator [Bacteroidota bacterium]